MVKQTAGRDQLGNFAPKFAQLNDDVLFGEVWSREEKLSLRDRSLVTIVSLMAQGLVDSSFQYHLRGNCGDSNPRGILRRMAESMGGFQNGEGSLDVRITGRERKKQQNRRDLRHAG